MTLPVLSRRQALRFLGASSMLTFSGFSLSGCFTSRIDKFNVLLRSDSILTPEDERAVVQKANLEWSTDGRIRVLYLRGTPYERGYQHGYLLRKEISENFLYMYERAVDKFVIEELFDEAYERARPFIPQSYVEEMHGLAHGSKLPLRIIHAMHILPEIGEWGGKKRIAKIAKQMIRGEFGTTCSNFCALPGAARGGAFYTVRILDWGLHRISKLHEFPLIAVHHPEQGYAFANIGWVGFIGAISGMNAQGITLGEMGYKNPLNETLRGTPMPFLLREVLQSAHSLKDVRQIIQGAPGTCSYLFLMSDGKTREAEMYFRDRDRFLVAYPSHEVSDGGKVLPAIPDTLYGGHYPERMTELLTSYHGQITPELLQREIIPKMAMPSNFQDVIYDPTTLQFWVANAKSPTERAAEQPYTFFDLAAALKQF